MKINFEYPFEIGDVVKVNKNISSEYTKLEPGTYIVSDVIVHHGIYSTDPEVFFANVTNGNRDYNLDVNDFVAAIENGEVEISGESDIYDVVYYDNDYNKKYDDTILVPESYKVSQEYLESRVQCGMHVEDFSNKFVRNSIMILSYEKRHK